MLTTSCFLEGKKRGRLQKTTEAAVHRVRSGIQILQHDATLILDSAASKSIVMKTFIVSAADE